MAAEAEAAREARAKVGQPGYHGQENTIVLLRMKVFRIDYSVLRLYF